MIAQPKHIPGPWEYADLAGKAADWVLEFEKPKLKLRRRRYQS